MKKLLIFLQLTFCCFATNFAQTAYYDAKALYALDINELDTLDFYKDLLILQADKDDWRNIHSFVMDPLRYIAEEKPNFNVQVISKLQNLKQQYRVVIVGGRTRFERKYSTTFDFVTTPQGPLEEVATSLVDIIFGSGLGANLGTGLIDATSSLLLNRAESELTLSFLSRLKEEFENRPFFIFSEESRQDQVKVDTFYLRQIFPSTYALISDYDQVISINIGKSLQNAFEEDLKSFYSSADKYLIPSYLKNDIVYHVFNIVNTSFTDLSKGMHPSVILSSLAEKNALPDSYVPRNAVDTFKCAVQLIEGVSQSLRDISPSRVWLKLDDYNKLSIREKEYFIALFYLQNRTILRKLGITGSRFQLGERATDFVQLQALIHQNLAFLEQIENKIADLRLINATRTDRTPGVTETQTYTVLNNNEQDRLRAFHEFAFMFSDVVQHIGAYVCWVNRNGLLCSNQFDETYLPVAKELLQVPLAVETKEYSAAFLKTLKVIETLHRNNPLYQRPQGFVRYFTLTADVVATDSPDRIKKVLEEVILPVGSFRVKRYSSSSVYISALVGVSAGAEWLDNPAVENKWAAQVSPFVPIGIDFNWGSRKLLKNSTYTTRGTSNGVFLSVLDFGAVVSYRFQMDNNKGELTSTNLPSIKLEQLLSPGLFYTHGFRNSPIVWGFGAQLTPRLRDIIDAKDITIDRANAFRFSTFIAVDLPVFAISAKNDRLPKYSAAAGQQELDRMMLRREIDDLSRQLFQASSTNERRQLQDEIKQKEKRLKKGN
ncbi:MAG: hypothetical protein IPJ74_19340 [Saprospiraceae bacterium]|nr:hypothetical protein [Saprospiraceae bacterium]